MSFVDSGAGQTMIACGEAFMPGTTRSCSIDVEGVAGTMQIRMMGTAELVVKNRQGSQVVLRLANCLLNPGQHSLISLAHIQLNPDVKVTLTNTNPHIQVGAHCIPL